MVSAHLRHQAKSTKLIIDGEDFKLLIAGAKALQHHRTLSRLHTYLWKSHVRCKAILLHKWDMFAVCCSDFCLDQVMVSTYLCFDVCLVFRCFSHGLHASGFAVLTLVPNLMVCIHHTLSVPATHCIHADLALHLLLTSLKKLLLYNHSRASVGNCCSTHALF